MTKFFVRILGCFAVAALCAPVAAAEMPNVPPLQGTLVLKSMPLSPIVNRKITTWIYLPPSYNDAKNANRRYPVLYLLHGQPGGWTDCYRSGRVEEMANKLITQGAMQPMILVAFDGNGPKGVKDLTNFCNRVDGYRVEDFIVHDLVPYIDRTYRTIASADGRGLWGYSSGGYGALNLGFKHLDVWHVLCSHAGFYSPASDAKAMTEILGAPGPLWDANSPVLNVQKLPNDARLHVYLDASPHEEGFADFQTIRDALNARHIDTVAQVQDKAHAWRLIVKRCRDSLLFASRCFGELNAPLNAVP